MWMESFINTVWCDQKSGRICDWDTWAWAFSSTKTRKMRIFVKTMYQAYSSNIYLAF